MTETVPSSAAPTNSGPLSCAAARRGSPRSRPGRSTRYHGAPVLAAVAVGIMVLSGLGGLYARPGAALERGSLSGGPARSATQEARPGNSVSAPSAGSLAGCGSGDGAPAASTPGLALGPNVGHPAALYNSQVEPYAVLTGPYAYVAGGAALRDLGYGYINLDWPGAPSKTNLVAAYMIWSLMDDSLPSENATLNGVNVTGTWSAYASPSPCWAPTFIYTFVADVTGIVVNGNNTLSNFPSGVTSGADPWSSPDTDPMDEGATLVAVYENDSLPVHAVTVYTGALTMEGTSASAELNYTTTVSATAETTYVLADGQLPGNEAVWNGSVIDSNAFPGTAPKDTSTTWSYGNLYDTKTYNVTVKNGSTTTTAGVDTDGSDCLTWIGQVLDVQVAPSKPPYAVSFEEQGLVNGTSWNVTTNGSTESGKVKDAASTITFDLANETYAFTVSVVPGYTTTEHSGSYSVDGGPVYIRVLFHQVLYPVTISETGLAAGLYWWTEVTNGSQSLEETDDEVEAGSTNSYDLANGTYNLTPSATDLYTAHPALDTFSVVGAPVAVTVTFGPPETYNVTFVERGLPSGTPWGGTTYSDWGDFSNRTSNGSFVLPLPNASAGEDHFYPDSVNGYSSPSEIPFGVSAGPETIDVNYSKLFSVDFTETGLPQHTSWEIELQGNSSYVLNSTFGTSNVFSVPNGSYTFTVESVWGFTAHPATGKLNVTGANLTETITFVAEPKYALNFTETGLPSGTKWSLEVVLPNNTELFPSSTTPTISLMEPNGSFYFEPESVPGFSVSPSYGYADVEGASVNESITFARVFAVTFTETGLPSGTYWAVYLDEQFGESDTPTIVFDEANGSLSFDVYSEEGFEPSPSSGSVSVNGANLTEAIVYSSTENPTYEVEFTETGLPTGTNWSVTLVEYTEWTTGTSLEFTEENGSFSFYVPTVDDAYDPSPASGTVNVTGAPVDQPISFAGSVPTYAVTLTETGLPPGTEWFANISGEPSLKADSASVGTTLADGSYTYAAASVDKDYASAGGSFTVDGSAVTVPVTFTLQLFAVTFTESGLPSGTEWYVNITGEPPLSSSTATSSTSLANGSYSYGAASGNPGFAAPNGKFTVSGITSVTVTFATAYAVTFTETGLPAGVSWFVNVTGSSSRSGTGASIVVAEANGEYTYTVATVDKEYSAPGGSFQVSGSATSVSVTFTLLTFPVTYVESGLPSGTTWYVNASGKASLSSATSTVATSLPNGTYTFTAATVDKSYEGAGGSFHVSGSSVQVDVSYRLVTFPVTFTESGLPSGAEWFVNVTGQPSQSSSSDTLVVELPNGTYTFTVGTTQRGYTAHAGSTTVSGGPVSVPVKFTSSSASAGTTLLGLPGIDGYLALGLLLAALFVLFLLIAFGRRKKREDETPVNPPTNGGGPPPASGP